MGCGVLFPRNYECKSDSEEELEQQGGVDQYGGNIVLILGLSLKTNIGIIALMNILSPHNHNRFY